MSRGRTFTGSEYPVRLTASSVVTSDGRYLRRGVKHATKLTLKPRKRVKR
jgi:hypothetical protein